MAMIFAGVKFTGSLTADRLEDKLRPSLTKYHDKLDLEKERNVTVFSWDQLQRIVRNLILQFM